MNTPTIAPHSAPDTARTPGHTPGPWREGVVYWSGPEDRHTAIFSTVNQDKICEVEDWRGTAKEESEANARLIAAAPELLCLLQRFYAATYGNDTDGMLCPLDFEQARAAIAKATGKEGER